MYFAGVSTCCAKTSTAPLERLKILFQAQNIHYRDMGKTTIYLEITNACTAPSYAIVLLKQRIFKNNLTATDIFIKLHCCLLISQSDFPYFVRGVDRDIDTIQYVIKIGLTS